MSELFCTPDQGKRLLELLPELKSVMTWIWKSKHPHYMAETRLLTWDAKAFDAIPELREDRYPALTLQELRDVAIKYELSISDLEDHLYSSTAPELAEWVIARLEEAK